jgi:ABC-type branched-subunit amino acid transport system substrate-binding protein
MKRTTIFLFFAMATAAAVFALVSCDEESAKEVPVGVVVPLTGVHKSTGLSMKNGMELALEEINGSSLLDGIKLKFVEEDSESTTAGARKAYEKLIERDGVIAVLGPYTSSSTEEIISIANQNKVISFSPTSAASKKKKR